MNIIIFLLILITLYIYAICPETSRRTRMLDYRGTMFAHRGYHCKELGIPENSISAFHAAIKHGYGIELDIHLTSDGKLVVFHDDTLNRMCGIPGTPESMTASDLTNCQLLGTQEKIPLLEDVLTLVNGQVPLLIEFKMPNISVKICENAYELLKSYHGSYLVQSFNTRCLHWFCSNAPDVLRGQLSSKLTRTNPHDPWIFRFLAEHLLINFLGRPDFISYKLSDLPTVSTSIIRRLFGTTFAVWTLRTREALKTGTLHYEMLIFEKSREFY